MNADAPVVQTENSEVSNTISNRQVVDLPLSLVGQSAMRLVESFIFLAPGTMGPGAASTRSTLGAFRQKRQADRTLERRNCWTALTSAARIATRP
jgi:hypothetical protein